MAGVYYMDIRIYVKCLSIAIIIFQSTLIDVEVTGLNIK